MISARELEERNATKRNVRKELHTRILGQLCRRIEMFHTLGKFECMLSVPEFIFGFPAYDLAKVTIYMHRQLHRLGYRVSILGLGMIYAAWGPKKQPHTHKVKKKEDQLSATELPSLANLKKAADSLRKKYTSSTK